MQTKRPDRAPGAIDNPNATDARPQSTSKPDHRPTTTVTTRPPNHAAQTNHAAQPSHTGTVPRPRTIARPRSAHLTEPAPDPTTNAPPTAALPVVVTPLTADQALERLEKQARRGRIADFERGAHGGLFAAEAFGTPFDHRVVAHAETSPHPTDPTAPARTTLRFELVRLRKLPAIFAAVLAFTIWPGSWMTDSLLTTYFEFYHAWVTRWPWLTYAWYLPLTALPIPWMWRAWSTRSHAMAHASARETIDFVRETIDGTYADPTNQPHTRPTTSTTRHPTHHTTPARVDK